MGVAHISGVARLLDCVDDLEAELMLDLEELDFDEFKLTEEAVELFDEEDTGSTETVEDAVLLNTVAI